MRLSPLLCSFFFACRFAFGFLALSRTLVQFVLLHCSAVLVFTWCGCVCVRLVRSQKHKHTHMHTHMYTHMYIYKNTALKKNTSVSLSPVSLQPCLPFPPNFSRGARTPLPSSTSSSTSTTTTTTTTTPLLPLRLPGGHYSIPRED